MNGLKALYRLLELIPENAEDIIQKANTIEGKIEYVKAEVTTHETGVSTWINEALTKAPANINDLLTQLEGSIKSNKSYLKVKDQDLSSLISKPEGITSYESSQWQDWIDPKITDLKTFLAPLEIKSAGSIFSIISELLQEVTDLPADLDMTNESLVQAYQQLKVQQLQGKMNQLIELITGLSLTPPDHDNEDVPQEILQALEDALPELEEKLQEVENQPQTISQGITFIKSLEPLFQQMISTLPLDKLGIDLKDPGLQKIWQQFQEEVQQIDTSTIPNAIDSSLKVFAKVCKEHLASDSPLSGFSEGVQKLQLIVGYLIENELFSIPLKINWLSENETLPKDQGLDQEWQAIQAAKVQQPGTNDATSSNTQADHSKVNTISQEASGGTENDHEQSQDKPQGVLPNLLHQGVSQLSPEQQAKMVAMMNGEAFASLIHLMESMTNHMSDAITELPELLRQAWEQQAINTLDDLLAWGISKVKAAVNNLIETFQKLINELINLLGQLVYLLLDLLLNIKIPVEFMRQWATSLHSLSNINLLCLLLAITWDVFDKLRHVEVSTVETWVNGN